MTATVFCEKLQKEAPALPYAPYPGTLGERIRQHISQEGWQLWVAHQTMLINEYRLNTLDPKARAFLQTEMLKFLFGEGSEAPTCFVPSKAE